MFQTSISYARLIRTPPPSKSIHTCVTDGNDGRKYDSKLCIHIINIIYNIGVDCTHTHTHIHKINLHVHVTCTH